MATLAALLLAGCGKASDPAAPPPKAETPRPPASAPPAQATASIGQPPAQGSALHGTASGLVADVSGLQGLVTTLGGEMREHEIFVALPADTLFAFDKADIQPASQARLQTLAELIGKTRGTVQLVGHTDSKGAEDYNLALSHRRAKAVADWLAAHGVPAERLQAEGRGAAEPIADNQAADGSDNPQGRALNRRVEALIPRD